MEAIPCCSCSSQCDSLAVGVVVMRWQRNRLAGNHACQPLSYTLVQQRVSSYGSFQDAIDMSCAIRGAGQGMRRDTKHCLTLMKSKAKVQRLARERLKLTERR